LTIDLRGISEKKDASKKQSSQKAEG